MTSAGSLEVDEERLGNSSRLESQGGENETSSRVESETSMLDPLWPDFQEGEDSLAHPMSPGGGEQQGAILTPVVLDGTCLCVGKCCCIRTFPASNCAIW